MTMVAGLLRTKQRTEYKNLHLRIGQLRLGSEGGFSDYAVVQGGGTPADPIISASVGGNFIHNYFKTTNVGALEVYGHYIGLESGGTGTGYVYTYGGIAKSVSGGYVAELGACYFKTQLTAGTVTGQCYVGFFELIVDAGVSNMPSGGVIQLISIVSGSLNAVSGFVCLREYGAAPMTNFLNILDTSATPGASTTILSTLGLRNIIGSTNTVHYLPLSKGISSTCAFFGRGNSSTYESVNVDGVEGVAIYLTAANAGSGEAAAGKFALKTGGGNPCYAVRALGLHPATGGSQSELAGLYCQAQLSGAGAVGTDDVTGQFYAAFFESIVDTVHTRMPSGGCIQLIDIINGNLNAVHGYICLRTYGTNKFSNLLNIMDHSIGDGSATVLVTDYQTDRAMTHGIKIRVGSTTMWLMATTTAPD